MAKAAEADQILKVMPHVAADRMPYQKPRTDDVERLHAVRR